MSSPFAANENDGAQPLGLGYQNQDRHNSLFNGDSDNEVNKLMQHYLQQCVVFHQQCQEERSKKEDSSIKEERINPIAAVKVEEEDQDSDQAFYRSQHGGISENEVREREERQQKTLHKQIESGRFRAQAILEKLNAQAKDKSSQLLDPSTARILTQPPEFYSAQRRDALANERDKLIRFWHKNVAYVMERDKKRLEASQDDLLVYQASLQAQQQARYEQRKRAVTGGVNVPGIGTEKRRRKEQRRIMKQQQLPTVAIYLSGLPASITADLIQPLFASYGTIRKVHLYRDKATDRLKGDGLVIFEVQDAQTPQEIVRASCGQVRSHRMRLLQYLLFCAKYCIACSLFFKECFPCSLSRLLTSNEQSSCIKHQR